MEYSSFAVFAQFVAREARIACNPITSFGTLKDDQEGPEQAKEAITEVRNRGTTLAISAEEARNSNKSDNAIRGERKCYFCKDPQKGHSLANCTEFEKQTMMERQAFMKENGLCFGCLRRDIAPRNAVIGLFAQDARENILQFCTVRSKGSLRIGRQLCHAKSQLKRSKETWVTRP